ncbi:hypothetical protein A1O7_09629 [Cladophialophora yegresii CBS 114405]|uniref:HMG box domain-containing protein n=1 Tax=Cladophialophora yegresii CBS 114405 TaxID=1182544 RepID=W9VQ71_9EURO|nr:uncharacterized protein A1O7_09629 [Cladophialophora yegresii CBS 114405]EXJ54291.1 hypothetical protein A1O7_09629 [Cladophialophora yegresii CBS 114405]
MDSISAYLAEARAPSVQVPDGLPKAQIDVIWQMGVASFPSNNNELVIPQFMVVKLSKANIEDLKTRLSEHFGNTPTTDYLDYSAKVLRICQAPELPAFAVGPAAISSAESQCTTPQSQMSAASPIEAEAHTATQSSSPERKLRQPDKKVKVTRPPNAFILYRTYYHPILLQSRPDLANNDISVMLGKQWKSESEEVKNEWKAKAAQVKKQHALENPGYQYAPRKPSEKKRRMTVRKLAKLQAAKGLQANSDVEMTDVADFDSNVRFNRMNRPHEVTLFFEGKEPISIDTCLANERASSYPSRLKKSRKTDEMSIVFPAGHDNVERDYNIKSARYEPRDPSEHINFSRSSYSDVRMDHDLSTLASDQFMNTLVDWDAIEADAKLVHDTINESNFEILNFDSEAERAQFQAEMNRVLFMFD